MKINNYNFGKITIKSKDYNHDVIIMSDSVKSDWWRVQFHLLTLEDIEKIIKDKPDKLLIGTGKFGLMKVKKEVIDYCKDNQIELIINDTTTVIKKFNEKSDSEKRIIAALHLTC